MNLRTVGAWTTAGVALWASLGALDLTSGPAGTQRVAMLPGIGPLAACVALALLLGFLLKMRLPDSDMRGRAPVSGRPRGTGDSFLPLYALIVLVLPYLPWLPDWLPLLQVFAGPGRLLVWLIVTAQVVWAVLGAGRAPRTVGRMRAWSTRRSLIVIFVVSLVVFSAASIVLIPSGLFPGGDEPHYLIVTQSLLKDHDLQIENNHQRRDYAAYFDGDLPPHAIAPGKNGAMYSVHPIGLPILAVPAFAAAGYRGVVLMIIVLAAAAAALAWVWVRRVTGSVAAATFAWSATALSLPFLGSSGTVFPEIPAALAVMIATTLAFDGATRSSAAETQPAMLGGLGRALVLGFSTASLPWLHAKYALMAAALLAIGLWRLWRDAASPRPDRVRHICVAAAIFAASVAAWLTFYYVIWGSPWPSAPYGGAEGTQMSLRNLVRGVGGLLADQEYGLMSYAPALGIGLLGLWSMWRAGGRTRGLAVELAVTIAALVGTVGAFQMWWGGAALPGRMVVSIVLLFAMPIGWEFRASADRPERRAAFRLLLLIGLSISLATVVAQGGTLLALRRDGVSRLLEWLSPDWHLWAFMPDFIMQSAWIGLLQSAIWIVAVVTSAWAVGLLAARGTSAPGSSRTGRGLAFLRANSGALLAALIASVVMPLALGARLKPSVVPEDRSWVKLLESFDPHGRSVAVRFDPLSIVDAASVPQLFTLSARPGSRTNRQPVAVLMNARFALPAGRYAVELSPLEAGGAGAALAGTLALQVGRAPVSLTEWDVDAGAARPWTAMFDLPVDVDFLGFRASGGLGERVGELRIRPVRVVPTLDRIAAYDVLAASTLDRFVFLYHDGGTYPEQNGFWLRGAARAVISVVSRTGRVTTKVRLRIRSPIRNSIRIETPGENWTVDLQPNKDSDIEVSPTALDGTLRMIMTPASGFRPSDSDPHSQDRRFLACWVEVVR